MSSAGTLAGQVSRAADAVDIARAGQHVRANMRAQMAALLDEAHADLLARVARLESELRDTRDLNARLMAEVEPLRSALRQATHEESVLRSRDHERARTWGIHAHELEKARAEIVDLRAQLVRAADVEAAWVKPL